MSLQLYGTAWVGAMTDAIYHSDPCLSPSLSGSCAGTLVNKTPRHARIEHPKFGGSSLHRSKAMDEGDIYHALVVQGSDSERVVRMPEDIQNFKTKRARELRDAAIDEGKTPVIDAKYEAFMRRADTVRAACEDKGISFASGAAEQVILWEETAATSGRIIQCRAKLDHWLSPCITEFKTCESAKPSSCERQIISYGYDISMAAYRRGVLAVHPELEPELDYRWVFAETGSPYCVTELRPSSMHLELGTLKWRYAVDLWDQAINDNRWPDYAPKPLVAEMNGRHYEEEWARLEAYAEG